VDTCKVKDAGDLPDDLLAAKQVLVETILAAVLLSGFDTGNPTFGKIVRKSRGRAV
jgi:hypothetical protein